MSDTFDPRSVRWVLTDLEPLLSAIETSSEVVLDLETTGLDERAEGRKNGGVPARIVLVSLTLPRGDDAPMTWVVPLSHPDSPWLGEWRSVMRRIALRILRTKRPLVNQNVKFDCRWIHAHTGVDLSSRIVWDTQVASHLLDETTSTKLKERAPAVFEVQRWDDFDLTYPGAAEAVPMFDLGIYAARDTYWTWRLATWQREQMFLNDDEPETRDEILNARLGKLAVWCSMPTVATLTGIEQFGIDVDREWVERELAEHRVALRTLSDTLAARYPLALTASGTPLPPEKASWAPTSHWFRDWTRAAVDAGELVVAELTPTGKSRWSKGVLVRQARAGSRVAAMLLDLRSHVKKIEYLSSWLDSMTADGTIHSTYHIGSVSTGRLSSSGPNMQQVTASLKPAFVPRPGHVFAELDYSQIELRAAAHIANCRPMIEAFRRGDDLHSLLASRITGKSEVSKEERQAGKSANFGLLYGMGAYGFMAYAETVYGVSFTRSEAHAVHRTFFETWDGLAQWHARSIEKVRRDGYVVSPIGRVRRLPQVWTDDTGGAERQAINAPVQGFASDLMQMASSSIMGNLPGTTAVRGARVVATVHDSILIEIPTIDAKRVIAECVERMVNLNDVLRRLDCELSVPLAVDVKVGTRWGLNDVNLV